MASVTVTKAFVYGGKQLEAGKPTEIADRDFRVLAALGKVVRREDTSPATEPKDDAVQSASVEKPKQKYSRRDMQAEG